MARRQLGHGRGGRMKIENDAVEVRSGVRHGRTLGSPIALLVANRDYANWEERMNPWPVEAEVAEVHLPRPGHADLVGVQKYGLSDVRNVLERASARETAARVAAGALAKAVPRRARRRDPQPRDPDRLGRRRRAPTTSAADDFDGVDESPVRCLDRRGRGGDGRRDRPAAQGQRVARRHLRGARLRARARARLARLLGRSASTAGSRRRSSRSRRSRASASATASSSPRRRARRPTTRSSATRASVGFYRETNHAGGIEGGMTNGEPLVVAGRDEAAADADQAAALGRHRRRRSRRRRCASAPTRPWSRRPASSARRWSRSCSPRLPREVRRRPHRRRQGGARAPTASASRAEAPVPSADRAIVAHRLHGRRQVERRRARSPAARASRMPTPTSCSSARSASRSRSSSTATARRRSARREEAVVLEVLARADGASIALGGGALRLRARPRGARERVTVWLEVESARTPPGSASRGSGRPLARDRERFAALLAERRPVYEAARRRRPAARRRRRRRPPRRAGSRRSATAPI